MWVIYELMWVQMWLHMNDKCGSMYNWCEHTWTEKLCDVDLIVNSYPSLVRFAKALQKICGRTRCLVGPVVVPGWALLGSAIKECEDTRRRACKLNRVLNGCNVHWGTQAGIPIRVRWKLHQSYKSIYPRSHLHEFSVLVRYPLQILRCSTITDTSLAEALVLTIDAQSSKNGRVLLL